MTKDVVTIDQNFSVKETINKFFKMNVSSVIIINNERKVTGIFTERDLIRVIAQGIPLTTLISDVMTTNVITISLDSTFAEARELMRLYRISHIPVVDDQGKIEGLISLRHLIDEIFETLPSTR